MLARRGREVEHEVQGVKEITRCVSTQESIIQDSQNLDASCEHARRAEDGAEKEALSNKGQSGDQTCQERSSFQ